MQETKPIVLSKKDYRFTRNVERNLFSQEITKASLKDLDNQEAVLRAINVFVKREVTNILFSLFQGTVPIPDGNNISYVNINSMKFSLNVSLSDINKPSATWFLSTIKNTLNKDCKLNLNDFLNVVTFGIENEPNMFKYLYEKILTIAPNTFLFKETQFSEPKKKSQQNNKLNPYHSLVSYWNTVKNKETLYLSTWIVTMITNYYNSYDELIKPEKKDEENAIKNTSKSKYDRTKYAFHIKQALSESSSTTEERAYKVKAVQDCLNISTEMLSIFNDIQDRLKDKVQITESEKRFFNCCFENLDLLKEVSALAALVKL